MSAGDSEQVQVSQPVLSLSSLMKKKKGSTCWDVIDNTQRRPLCLDPAGPRVVIMRLCL